jgi:DnaJ-class molecular chaperone
MPRKRPPGIRAVPSPCGRGGLAKKHCAKLCGYCNGSGTVWDDARDDSMICPACHGRGMHGRK